MKVRQLSHLLAIVRGMDTAMLRYISDFNNPVDYMDKAIVAIAKGEVNWREQV
jgi:hypothetical protein